MPTTKVTARDWATLIILALIWGVSFLFIKKAVAIFTPTQVAFWRVSFSVVFNLPVLYAFRREIDWSRWKPLILIALAGSALPSVLFAVAQRHVDSSLAGILNALTPFFALLIGVLFYKTQVNQRKVLGVLMGLGGAAFLILLDPDATNGQSQTWAAALCVLATVSYAVSATVLGQYLQDMHPAAITAAAFTLMAPVFFTGLWWSGGMPHALTHPDGLKGLAYIAFLSGVGTVIASYLYFGLIQRTGIIFGTSVTYLLPVVSIVFGLFDGERIHATDLVGSALILGALYLAKK